MHSKNVLPYIARRAHNGAEDIMAKRRRTGCEEIFGDVADEMGWTKAKQVKVLLAFIEERDLEAELEAYLEDCSEDDDTEEVERDEMFEDLNDSDD